MNVLGLISQLIGIETLRLTEERVVTWRPEDVKRERDEANVRERFVFVLLIFFN
jgi:hypothetical protein